MGRDQVSNAAREAIERLFEGDSDDSEDEGGAVAGVDSEAKDGEIGAGSGAVFNF